ncbi:thioredoxin, partial [Corynebacterium pseudodiphtheriticum]
MNYVNAVIEDKAAFERALDTPKPVFVVFISDRCAACRETMPGFMRISEPYKDQIKLLILDCANTPRHPQVGRIPMLLIYRDQALVQSIPGLSEQALESAFEAHTRR